MIIMEHAGESGKKKEEVLMSLGLCVFMCE